MLLAVKHRVLWSRTSGCRHNNLEFRWCARQATEGPSDWCEKR
jgi:hypothetical protein